MGRLLLFPARTKVDNLVWCEPIQLLAQRIQFPKFLMRMSNCFFLRVGSVLALFAAWLVLAPSAFSENPAAEHVKLQLVSAQDAIVPGHEIELGVRFDLQDGWHTYWQNPGDSGEAPRIDWALPSGFQAGAIQWPYPERMVTGPLTDYGYEHQVLLMVAVRPPSGLKEGTTQKISAHIRYLVCRDVCIPGEAQLDFGLPVKSQASSSAAAQSFQAAQKQLPQPAPSTWKISVLASGEEFVVSLKNAKSAANAQFFPLHAEEIDNAAQQTVTAIPGGIRLHLKKSPHLLKPISRLEGIVVVGSGNAYSVNIPVVGSGNRESGNHKQSGT